MKAFYQVLYISLWEEGYKGEERTMRVLRDEQDWLKTISE